MNIKTLKINDIIDYGGRLYKVELKPCSNGSIEWFSPILKLFKPEIKNKAKLSNSDKLVLMRIFKDIDLGIEDFPINEDEIKKKDIYEQQGDKI